MARNKMVTRTVKYTIAEVMVVNTETAEVSILTEKCTGDFRNAEDLKKYLSKDEEETGYSTVKVTIIGTEEKLFGMSESDFLLYAEELPQRRPQSK